jgi:hypothetical protein
MLKRDKNCFLICCLVDVSRLCRSRSTWASHSALLFFHARSISRLSDTMLYNIASEASTNCGLDKNKKKEICRVVHGEIDIPQSVGCIMRGKTLSVFYPASIFFSFLLFFAPIFLFRDCIDPSPSNSSRGSMTQLHHLRLFFLLRHRLLR